jgi:peptidylprolyl isomerase
MTTQPERPEIDAPEGPAPTELVVEDVVVGDGPEATPGSTVDVHYLGVEYETGDEFDASWNRGQSINFPLRSLIAGWQQGIPGMKVGGRRKLVVPPELAYGPAGGGHRLSGKTLIFVIDLLGVSRPAPPLPRGSTPVREVVPRSAR